MKIKKNKLIEFRENEKIFLIYKKNNIYNKIDF